MQVITHHRHAVNLTRAERIASTIGGGFLLAAGVARRGPWGIALAIVGGDFLRRGITGHSYLYQAVGVRTAPKGQGAETTSVRYELGVRVDKAITIARPRDEVFRFWRDVTNFPKFMKHVESVRVLDDGRSHWVAKAPAGRTVEWDAAIHNEAENELIAWRSLPGADVDNAGSVLFRDAPGGRGTEVKVELQYNPPAGVLGAATAMLWGEEPGQQIQEDLHRLKQLMETGEVITTEGQTSGRPEKSWHDRLRPQDRSVHQASEASFPASDAPAYTH
jgi:uncharacterized membrane protein